MLIHLCSVYKYDIGNKSVIGFVCKYIELAELYLWEREMGYLLFISFHTFIAGTCWSSAN